MKEIKAFIHPSRIAAVLRALRDSGVCDMDKGAGCHGVTVSQVQRPLSGADSTEQHYSMELAEPVILEYRLELICPDEVADSLVDIVAQAAHTGQRDKGWLVLSDVVMAI